MRNIHVCTNKIIKFRDLIRHEDRDQRHLNPLLARPPRNAQ